MLMGSITFIQKNLESFLWLQQNTTSPRHMWWTFCIEWWKYSETFVESWMKRVLGKILCWFTRLLMKSLIMDIH